MPPFNLRGALFRVRAPFRFPSVLLRLSPSPCLLSPSPQRRAIFYLFSLCALPFSPPLASSPPILPTTEASRRRFSVRRRSRALYLNTRSPDSSKTPRCVLSPCNYKLGNRSGRQLLGYRSLPSKEGRREICDGDPPSSRRRTREIYWRDSFSRRPY